jgi:hypothetical protein
MNSEQGHAPSGADQRYFRQTWRLLFYGLLGQSISSAILSAALIAFAQQWAGALAWMIHGGQ